MKRVFYMWIAVLMVLAGGIRGLPRRRFRVTSKPYPGPVLIEGRWHIPTGRGLMAAPAGGAPSALEQMQKDVADVASFMRDKYDPLQQSVTVLGEEHKRLVDQVKEVLDMQREMNRAALLKDTGGRRMTLYRSVSGLSDHLCDDLDFEILSKFARRAFAVDEEKGDSDGM